MEPTILGDVGIHMLEVSGKCAASALNDLGVESVLGLQEMTYDMVHIKGRNWLWKAYPVYLRDSNAGYPVVLQCPLKNHDGHNLIH
jgi:hypothetical protein